MMIWSFFFCAPYCLPNLETTFCFTTYSQTALLYLLQQMALLGFSYQLMPWRNKRRWDDFSLSRFEPASVSFRTNLATISKSPLGQRSEWSEVTAACSHLISSFLRVKVCSLSTKLSSMHSMGSQTWVSCLEFWCNQGKRCLRGLGWNWSSFVLAERCWKI